MAVLANIGSRYVVRVFSGRVDTIVTVETPVDYPHVIERRRYPSSGGMAIVALRTRGDMVGRFSAGLKSIVAPTTAAGYRGVIHICRRNPRRRRMTISAKYCRRNMVSRP